MERGQANGEETGRWGGDGRMMARRKIGDKTGGWRRDMRMGIKPGRWSNLDKKDTYPSSEQFLKLSFSPFLSFLLPLIRIEVAPTVESL